MKWLSKRTKKIKKDKSQVYMNLANQKNDLQNTAYIYQLMPSTKFQSHQYLPVNKDVLPFLVCISICDDKMRLTSRYYLHVMTTNISPPARHQNLLTNLSPVRQGHGVAPQMPSTGPVLLSERLTFLLHQWRLV